MSAELRETAPGKINLSLRVLGRRVDGYHELESLVVFSDIGDELIFTPHPEIAFALSIDMSALSSGAGLESADQENLVLRAARSFQQKFTNPEKNITGGQFHLIKRLPVAAGIGGGSADAAAALRILAKLNMIALDDPELVELALDLGADVPICLLGRASFMCGIGENITPLETPLLLHGVLVNPGHPLATRDVFDKLGLAKGQEIAASHEIYQQKTVALEDVLARIALDGNDLEKPARGLMPEITQMLNALKGSHGCHYAAMSGSGASCFGLYAERAQAELAAGRIAKAYQSWWVQPVSLS